MREQEIICTICPLGCHIHVVGEGDCIQQMKGHNCTRGKHFARSEFICPVRTLTTTVYVDNAKEPLLAVRSEKPLPKDKLFACMETIRNLVFYPPIGEHEVLIEDIAGTGVNIIACAAKEEER